MPSDPTVGSNSKGRWFSPSLRRVRTICVVVAVVSLGLLAVSSRRSLAVSLTSGGGDSWGAVASRGKLTVGWYGAGYYKRMGGIAPTPGLSLTAEAAWDDAVSVAWRPYRVSSAPPAVMGGPVAAVQGAVGPGAPTPDYQGVVLPLWMVVLPALIGAAYTHGVVVGMRRGDPGRCGKCGYSRAGLAADALCPECGGG